MNWQRVDSTWMRLEARTIHLCSMGSHVKALVGGWWVCDKDQDESGGAMCLVSRPGSAQGVGMVSGWRSVAVFSEVSLNTMVKTC